MSHRRYPALSAALAEAKAGGRSAGDVAADAHIARETLSRIVAGRHTPRRLTGEAIAGALGRDVATLFSDLERADAANAA